MDDRHGGTGTQSTQTTALRKGALQHHDARLAEATQRAAASRQGKEFEGVWQQKTQAITSAKMERAWFHQTWDPLIARILNDVHALPERAQL